LVPTHKGILLNFRLNKNNVYFFTKEKRSRPRRLSRWHRPVRINKKAKNGQ